MRAIDADAFKDYIRGACEDMKHLFKDNADFAKLITESFCKDIDEQPTIHPEPHEIGYDECANALLKMWMDGILTDWVYNRIADKLNEKWGKTEFHEPYKVGVTDDRF